MREQLTSRPKFYVFTPWSVTVGTAVFALDASSIPNGASGALVTAMNQDLAIGFTNVATNIGIVLPAKESFDVNRLENLQKLKSVRMTGTDGVLSFTFYTE